MSMGWALVKNRSAMQREKWFRMHASRLKEKNRIRLELLLKIITQGVKADWTQLRPSDPIGPYLFQGSVFEIESDWVLVSDHIKAMDADMYRIIEEIWKERDNVFVLEDLIESLVLPATDGQLKGVSDGLDFSQ